MSLNYLIGKNNIENLVFKFVKKLTIWRIFMFRSVFSWQFSKIYQKIAKSNAKYCWTKKL